MWTAKAARVPREGLVRRPFLHGAPGTGALLRVQVPP